MYHLFVIALSALNAPTLNVIEYYEVGFEFNQNLTTTVVLKYKLVRAVRGRDAKEI